MIGVETYLFGFVLCAFNIFATIRAGRATDVTVDVPVLTAQKKKGEVDAQLDHGG